MAKEVTTADRFQRIVASSKLSSTESRPWSPKRTVRRSIFTAQGRKRSSARESEQFTELHNEYPIALSDPNRVRDLGVDFGHSFAGQDKYQYRLMSPAAHQSRSRMTHSDLEAERRSQSTHKRLFSSTFGGDSSKRAYMSMHVMDGMTDYEQAAPPNTRLYARPLNYTLSRSGAIPEAALMNTMPAGVP